jgi:hypothetical protein
VKQLLREEADAPARGRSWKLPLEDRLLLVATCWRTNFTLRQLVPLFGESKSSADRVIDRLGPILALRQRERLAKDAALVVDGALVPTRDHTVAEQSKNYRHSTNHQVVIDADSRFVVVAGRPLPGNRNDCKAWVVRAMYGSRSSNSTAAPDHPGVGRSQPAITEQVPAVTPDWQGLMTVLTRSMASTDEAIDAYRVPSGKSSPSRH